MNDKAGLDAKRLSVAILIVAFACLRLCHIHLLWADEDYHLSAAINILHGRMPYRDFWYDKPPLPALYYLMIGGENGWPLRLLDTGFVLAAAYLAYRLARDWWGEMEGITAALLLAFFLAFYLPSAVIPFAADAVMLLPHLAAVYCAQRKAPFLAGIWVSIAFLANVKAVFVAATCLAWMPFAAVPLLAGAVLPLVAVIAAAFASGAWQPYIQQVWQWGFAYTKGSPVANPFHTGIVRTLDWSGFHAAAVAGTCVAVVKASRSDRWRLGTWLLFSFIGVSIGTRFAPHYFLQLLPPVVIAASRGITIAVRRYGNRALALFCVLAVIPLARFGPRYVTLSADDLSGHDPHWSDVVMDLDSRQVARQVRGFAQPNDTLFVWGYRPDIYVYTRMVSDSLFSDSQPLTGVPADRHLSGTSTIPGVNAASNRIEFAKSSPTFLIDGLSLMNPKLAPQTYPELRTWFAHYKLIGRTRLSLIYRQER